MTRKPQHPAPPPRTDPEAGFRDLVASIRRLILDHRMPPGQRLPGSDQLATLHGTSVRTIQRTLEVLAADGLVVARRRAGTFVHDHPPFLHHYAMAFFEHPSDDLAKWTHYHEVWNLVAREFNDAHTDRRIEFFYDIDHHADNESHRQLHQLAARGRIAGLLMPIGGEAMATSPLFFDLTSLPKVAGASDLGPGVTHIKTDQGGVLDLAIQHLKARSRKRLAILCGAGSFSYLNLLGDQLRDALPKYFKGLGLTCLPRWVHVVYPRPAWGVESIVELLLHAPAHERPDAIILLDDHYLPPTLAAVQTSGLRIGPGLDLDIVSQTNFPNLTPTDLPVIQVGLDIRRSLAASIDAIDRARRDGVYVPQYLVPAIDASEAMTAANAHVPEFV